MSRELPDRFELLEELSRGPTKSLLRCRDVLLQREVILQIPGSSLTHRLPPEDRDRMLREARMLARVQHPGVSRLLEVVESPSGPLMVLEPRAGETLAERLQDRKRLPATEVRRIGLAVSEAAEAVHAAGVVHRGIDEANILLTSDAQVVLTGFEFSKALSHGFGQSSIDYRSSGQGLPSYPAPEQLEGHAADARSDVYALGCVLYHCLTGTAPTTEWSDLEWRAPKDPRELVGEAPEDLLQVIRRCLHKSPLKRFPSMAEVGDALRAGEPEPRNDAVETEQPRASRRPLRIGLALAALVVIALGLTQRQRLFGSAEDHDPYYARSLALLVGIDYTGPLSDFEPLDNAQEDVLAIEKRLLDLGWGQENVQVLVGRNATKSAIESALRRIEDEAGPEDQVFVYYSGHGVPHENSKHSGFAIPSDARNDPERTNWLHFDAFDRVYDHSRAKHILIALDCCYSGAFLSRSTKQEYNYSETLLTRRAHLMMVSSRDGLAADSTVESPDHSPFARAFLQTLDEAASKPRTATNVQARAQDLVQSQTWAQAPVLYHRLRSSSGTADFVFMRRSDQDGSQP